GRAVPAVFERATGKFLYFHLQQNGHKGGSSTLATGDWFVNAGASFDAATGTLLDPVGKGEVAAFPDGLVCSTAKDVVAFKWADKGEPVTIRRTTEESPYGENAAAVAAAEEIVRQTGVKEGYCVDLGCGDGALAYELARRTQLHVYAVDPDPEKVALARKKLDA